MSRKEIKIFFTLLSKKNNFSTLLSSEEKKIFKRLSHPLRRKQFCTARLLLKRALRDHDPQLKFQDLSFHPPTRGAAPHLFIQGKKDSRFAVSLSHCEELVTVAILLAKNSRVGIDLERIKPRQHLKKLFHFLEESPRIPLPLEETRALEEFLQLWTLKEATLKCLGTGFLENPKNLKVDFERESVFHKSSKKKFFWKSFEITFSKTKKRFVLSVVSNAPLQFNEK